MSDLIIFFHNECLLKFNGVNHPERKERLDIIFQSIQSLENINIEFKKTPLASFNDINLVHPEYYIKNMLSKIPTAGLVSVEKEPFADTFLCPFSKNAILRACGSGISAADSLIKNNDKKIFCSIRPPGHHAETLRANGFCFVNNIAVSARYLQKTYKINKNATKIDTFLKLKYFI